MRGNLKRTGLALLAILALGAVAAQGAWAHQFKVGSHPAILTAEQDPQRPAQTFTAEGNTIECHKFHADGTQAEEQVETIELIPQYSECAELAGFPVTVTNNGNTKLNQAQNGTTGGCKFVLHGHTTANAATSGAEDGPVDIQCEVGAALKIEIFGNEAHSELLCTMTIAEWHGKNGSTDVSVGEVRR